MAPEERIDRRRFQQWSAAALGGLALGGLAGCGDGEPAADGGAAAAGEWHLCRGLNECKGQGPGGGNACRGQGACATLEAHACGGQNACKGQGGCGENPGLNECKGQGGCHIPLMDAAWEKVRARLEGQWQEKGREFGAAPAAAES